MDNETITLVFQGLSELTAANQTAFIVWVLSVYVAPVVGWLCTLPVLAFIILRIVRAVSKAHGVE